MTDKAKETTDKAKETAGRGAEICSMCSTPAAPNLRPCAI